ncbi:MAG: hypothetical protein EOO53_01875 [Gammaproteobacteria bacterium]|nr:MAG: hypothetical protein EOO53_01875 [Gammaproteobacteria bacterium]
MTLTSYFFALLILFFLVVIVLVRIRKKFQVFLDSSPRSSAENFVSVKMQTWNKTTGVVESAYVKKQIRFVVGGAVYKYSIDAVVGYSVNEKTYVCKASPYGLFDTNRLDYAKKMERALLMKREASVYYDPIFPEKSFYLFDSFRSWDEYISSIS